jgi:hypothetical protein
MKVVNLCSFLAVIVFAAFVNWLALQLFPWHEINTDALEHVFSSAVSWEQANPSTGFSALSASAWKDEIRAVVSAYGVVQNALAYLIAGACAMMALRFGEKQLFPRQASVNWKLAVPLWLVPMGYLIVMSGIHEHAFKFILYANCSMIAFLGLYAFAYQAIGAYKNWKNSPTILA